MSASLSRVRVTSSPSGIGISTEDGRVDLGSVGASVSWSDDGANGEWSPSRWAGGDADRVATGGPHGLELALRVSVVDDDRAVEMSLCVTNRGDRPLRIDRITVLDTRAASIGVDHRRWSMYRNGHQSWSGTRTYRMDERDLDMPTAFLRASATDPAHKAPSGRGHVRSDSWTAVAEPDSGDAIGVGFLTTAGAFSYVELDAPHGRTPRLTAWCDMDGAVIDPGASLSAERLGLVAACGPSAGSVALESILERCGRAMSARLDGGRRDGWCSWYYYFQNVTESDVDANLAVLAADGVDGPRFSASYVMIDDGHQSAIGDWLSTAPSFPSGMAAVAERIRGGGFDAGLWWAPFLCAADSTVARHHPDWLLTNSRGRPVTALVNPAWGRRFIRAFDTTRPEVLEHLSRVAATMVGEWGYDILKLDFLFAASLPGVRAGDGTRAEALRSGLDAIRSGAGDSAFLLGCGCPLGPAVGVVDAMRIGADVSPVWEMPTAPVQRRLHGISTRHAVRNILTRSGMDGRLWDNDPDCLMVRATDTRLTLDEVRLLATVIGITNGMIVVSDDVAALSPERVEIIGRTKSLRGGDVEVVDLFDRDIPELVVSRHADHVDVAVLNLDDDARSMTVDLRRHGIDTGEVAEVVELWSRRSLRADDGLVRLGRVAAHGAAVLRVPS